MTLELKHFDTRLNQWVHSDNDLNNSETLITENLDKTLLEFFLPEPEFSFGAKDEYGKAEDLLNHPDGDVLLLSSKSRLVYGSPECLDVIEKLCPDRKDRGAYGSIFIGECNHSIVEKLNVLVVDDATGENGGIIDQKQAYKLTGDCYGQVSERIYDRLTQRKEGENYSVIQHRFGWREGDGTDSGFRFGKGTLKPHKLDRLDFINEDNPPKIDLILPLSSFKGTDKDNPNGAIKPQIKPGLYTQQMWLGEKSLSQKGKTSISQVIPSFPGGLRDYLEKLESEAQRLSEIQSDPRELAKLYVEKYEERRNQVKSQASAGSATESKVIGVAAPEALSEDNQELEEGEEREDPYMYRLLKADVSGGHFQLVETERVRKKLAEFVQKQWTNIATGYAVTFDRALIIPSKDLKNGEICVPWMNDGEKVLNFRSPFLNANGMCVSTNKIVSDIKAPDGSTLEGVIVVNDETLARIKERIDALEAAGIKTDEAVPQETESERQGRDFDGDCIGVALASDFPNLALEAERRNEPENAYAPTVKLAKQSFYNPDGTQPPFEEIAHFMSDGLPVGIINNQVTRFVALESEIEVLKRHGTQQEKANYTKQVAAHYQKLLYRTKDPKQPPIEPESKQAISEVINLAKDGQIDAAMDANQKFYRSLVEAACFQNQIAVDMFKSARSPDMKLINNNKRFAYRSVNYLTDRKSPTAYLNRGIETTGFSPVELIVEQTNRYFQENELQSRPMIQFDKLFKGAEFTNQQKLAVTKVKLEFDEAMKVAVALDKRREQQTGASATFQTAKGNLFELDNLAASDYPEIFQSVGRELEMRLDVERGAMVAFGKSDGLPIGTLTRESRERLNPPPGTMTKAVMIGLHPEISKDQVQALFAKAYQIAKDFRTSIPPSELPAMAAAAWSVSTTREELSQKEASAPVEPQFQGIAKGKKVSSFVFSTFTSEIAERLGELQFEEFLVSNIDKSQDLRDITTGELLSLEFRGSEDPGRREVWSNSSRIGTVAETSAQLPIKAQATGTVEINEAATATGKVNVPGLPPVEFLIREVKKFDYSDQIFQGEAMPVRVANVSAGNKVKIAIEGKILGEVAPDSVKDLEAANYCENGNLLKLKLQSVGEGQFRYIIGTSPTGRQLRINGVEFGDYKDITFKDTDLRRLTLEVSATQRKDAVLVGDKVVGVLHLKKDKEALRSLGLYGKQFNVKLESNYTTLTVNIDPQSVRYPQVKEYQPQAISAQSLADKLAAQIKDRPTMMVIGQDDLALGTVTLAVDSQKEKTVEEWLARQDIEFTKLDPETYKEEKAKGITVYGLVRDSIKDEDIVKMEHKFGVSEVVYAEQVRLTPNLPDNLKPQTYQKPPWERNLIDEALTTLKDRESAFFGNSHTVHYSREQQKITIANSKGDAIYQSTLAEPATIDRLSQPQKDYYANAVIPDVEGAEVQRRQERELEEMER